MFRRRPPILNRERDNPRAGKTHYAVRVLHRDEAGRKKHEEIGFNLGWNQCLDQLIELVAQLKR
jgi:uncharacterized protein YndB with AHSA1/START domain